MRAARRARVGALLMCCFKSVAAAPSALHQLSLEQLLQIRVTSVSRNPEALGESFASVFVITRRDLDLSQAQSLREALRLVPGLAVSVDAFGVTVLSARGIKSRSSEKILLLLNGHSLNDVRSGSATFQFLDQLPLAAVAQIEVVLGPGSAVYGANAFLGVINVVTHAPSDHPQALVQTHLDYDEHGQQLSARNTSILWRGPLTHSWDAFVNLHWQNDPGASLAVTADAFGRGGQAATTAQAFNAYVTLQSLRWQLQGRYLERIAGDYFGALHVLNDDSRQQVQSGFVQARFADDLGPELGVEIMAYINHQATDNAYSGFPPGSASGTPYEPWNNTGIYSRLQAREIAYGAHLAWHYHAIAGHQLSAGLELGEERLEDPRNYGNFGPGPLPEPRDLTENYNWISAQSRQTRSLYVQDVWTWSPTLKLNMDARLDHSDDFGASFNPRAGFHWQWTAAHALRSSYGFAYRAPDAYAMYLQNNPILLGNPELDEERIRSLELAYQWQPNPGLQLELIAFSNHLRDLIDVGTAAVETAAAEPAVARYANLGRLDSQGVSVVLRYQPSDAVSLHADYSHTTLSYAATYAHPDTPRRMLSARVQWQASRALSGQLLWQWQDASERRASDPRAALPAYTLADLSLHWQLSRAVRLSASVHNALNKHYAYPAPPFTLAEDYPAPGRSLRFGVELEF